MDILNFRLAYERNGGEINIYARVEETGTFLLIKTIDASYPNTGRVLFGKDEVMNKFSEFNKIQFKIELIR
jgi:hypothetical protein